MAYRRADGPGTTSQFACFCRTFASACPEYPTELVGAKPSKLPASHYIRNMPARFQMGRTAPLDSEPLSLSRRATYRRVLALLGTGPHRFVISGALGLSLQLGRLLDGELELCVRAAAVPAILDAVATTGVRVERHDAHGKARLVYGTHRVVLRWSLPSPLFGDYDDSWFNQARRARFLGQRVKVAPIEELLWLKIALPSGASLGDPLVGQILLGRGAGLDWPRLLARLAGQEALLLSHLFLFWHQYPESARTIIPNGVVDALRARIDFATGDSAEVSLDPDAVEDRLADQSLHRGT